MGYPLHGHELSLDINPVEAGVGWAVGWNKDAFWGSDALRADQGRRAEAAPARAQGVQGTGIPRPGMAVVDADGTPLGEVTSGTFSPTLGLGIALALLDAVGPARRRRRRAGPRTGASPSPSRSPRWSRPQVRS